MLGTFDKASPAFFRGSVIVDRGLVMTTRGFKFVSYVQRIGKTLLRTYHFHVFFFHSIDIYITGSRKKSSSLNGRAIKWGGGGGKGGQ